jgi:hypothetical protein
MQLLKYPRTAHLEGSRLQPGDEDLDSVRWSELSGHFLVIEEKIDGANAALSFDEEGRLLLQSRGHYLVGGAREKHFALFKTWATTHQKLFQERLQSRYVVYGEWLYAKHTVFYDALPHYFLEFDVFDRELQQFLSTERRRLLLDGLPIASVPVLAEGRFKHLLQVCAQVGHSRYKSEAWLTRLRLLVEEQGLDWSGIVRETDASSLAEGLYIKHEADGVVRGRFKFVRASFLTSVVDSGSHWLSRPIVPNQLAVGVDIFAVALER